MILLKPAEWVGFVIAMVAFAAGVSFWSVVTMGYEAWTHAHARMASGIHPQFDVEDDLVLLAVVLAGSILLHGWGWIARSAMVRRSKTIGMSADFWKVLYYSAYGLGFVVGAFIFLTAP
jgi:hypothetical protein